MPYSWFENMYPPVEAADPPPKPSPPPKADPMLANRLMRFRSTLPVSEKSAGRRLRVFSMLVKSGSVITEVRHASDWVRMGSSIIEFPEEPTYGQALAAIENDPELRSQFTRFPVRVLSYGIPCTDTHDHIPEDYVWEKSTRDPELPSSLQDLARIITFDLSEACNAFDDPDYFYPGVDEGIEPVTDEHVGLVIWAVQRELKRELRRGKPAAPIDALPWRVQRAFVERRRLRYQQWGIGRKQWQENEWSLWDVPEDADWVPSWI